MSGIMMRMLLVVYVVIGAVSLFERKPALALYWFCAGGLNAAVLLMGDK